MIGENGLGKKLAICLLRLGWVTMHTETCYNYLH